MDNQLYIFFIFILTGFLIGIFFDCFRILRKAFKTSDIITYLQDFIFWIITGILILFCVFKFNNGELRLYIFIGIISGFSLYLLIFSNVFIKVNLFIIIVIKKCIKYVVIIPIKFISKILRKILFKPISFCFINTRKIMSNLLKKIKKIFFKIKFLHKKKDFA